MMRLFAHAQGRFLSYLVLALLGLLPLMSFAAEVGGVQSGTAVSNGNGTLVVTLAQPVDPARSVLFFHTRHDSNRPSGSMLRGVLQSATTLSFTRVSNETSAIDIRWSVVEFATGVQVQRGQFSQTGTSMTIGLAQPVASTAQAFVLWSKTPDAGGGDWSADDPIGGYLINNTQLRFTTSNENDSHIVAYQVVEFTDSADILVQAGDSPGLAGGNRSRNINLGSNVDPASTFVLAGYTSDDSGSDVGERMMRAEVVDADTVRFSRQATGDRIDRIVWQVVELRDGSRVLQGIEDFSPGQALRTVTLPSAVDPSRSVAFSGVQPVGGQNMGSSAYRGDDVIGVGSFTFDLAASTLDIQRASTADDASVGWFVIEFNGAAVPPTLTPVLDVPMDEVTWAAGVQDVAGGNNGSAVNGAATASANPAVPGNPGTCRYGEFDGNDDYLEFADGPQLDRSSELTVAIWVNSRVIPGSGLKSIVSKDTNYEFHLNSSGRINWLWNDALGTTREFDSTTVLATDTWYHVAMTYESGNQVIYLDGVAVGTRNYTGDLSVNDLPLQVGQDQNFPDRFWDGSLDELRIFDQALSGSEVQAVMAETRPCDAGPVGEWHFDEYGWNGTPGEVVDYSGNGHDGVATNTVTGVGLLCNSAGLRASGTGDYLSLDASAVDGLTDFTLGVWYQGSQTNNHAIVSGARSGEADELLMWMKSPSRFDPDLNGSGGPDINTAAFNDGDWHFLVWTRSGAENCFYVDDVRQDCENRSAAQLKIDAGGFIVGQDQDSVGGGFDSGQDLRAELDELIIFDSVLSAAEIAGIRANNLAGLNWDATPRICPVTGAFGFVINHDNAGINCLEEPITVAAVDAVGALVPSYGSQVTLTTSTGRGTWTLLAGSGTLLDATADDGQATYAFDTADNGVATFQLYYPEGLPLVNVDIYQSDDVTVRDDDNEGVLAFAPSGLTLTASALSDPPPSPINDPLPTQMAGTPFPLHIAAYGTTDDDPLCGVIESYDGNRSLTFSMNYLDPGSGTRVAAVDGQNVNTGLAQSVPFSSGQAQVPVIYKDVGSISLSVLDQTSFPDPLAGGTNPFVVKPASLVISRVESAAGLANPAATSMNADPFVAAGEAFHVDVEARDSDGDTTPNFGRESVPEGVRVSSTGLVLPVGGRHGSANDVINGASFSLSGVGGRFTNTSILFDEVGVIDLLPALLDGDYLGTGPVPGPPSGNVGRFYPASFDLVSDTLGAACGTFTYMDQPELDLDFRLQALDLAGNVTQNYDASLLGAGATAQLSYSVEAADDGVDRGARLSPISGAWVLGQVLVNEPALAFARAGAPDGPLDPWQLSLRLLDPVDAIELTGRNTNPDAFGDCLAAGDCSHRTLGAATSLVYGRLMVLPAYGPEDRDLPVTLEAQAYVNGAFEHHAADSCTEYAAVQAGLSGYTGNLIAGETSVIGPGLSVPLLGGRSDANFPLLLAAPGFGNQGEVDVTLDVPSWLKFDWNGSGAEDPMGTATFGRHRGHDRIIYWSEQR